MVLQARENNGTTRNTFFTTTTEVQALVFNFDTADFREAFPKQKGELDTSKALCENQDFSGHYRSRK